MRLIDADELEKSKFHSLPYTHIIPRDVEAESYKTGWNDAIDAIIADAPVVDTQADFKLLCEELKAHVDYLNKKNMNLEGQIKALAFAVRCNGVGGNEVSYEIN